MHSLPTLDDIANRLGELGLSYWLPVIHRWLSRFKGLEDFMDPSMHPTLAVLEVLEQFSEAPGREELAQKLSCLDFLTLRVRHTEATGSIWDSRVEPFMDYCCRGKVEVWQSDREYPSPNDTRDWLLANIPIFSPSIH